MKKKVVVTGDRPTGALHLGHYVGSLKNRIELQEKSKYEIFNIIADYQVLTDRLDTSNINENVKNVLLDYLSCGINSDKTTIFLQSKVPQLSELFMYFSMLVTVSKALQNPTIKDEVETTGKGIMSLGMLNMPVSQAADILAFNAELVPVGEDQLPHIEQTREVARKFNTTYENVFCEPKAMLSDAPRLLGLDGKQKMSKSRNNAIFLKDSKDEVVKKIKRAVTDSEKTIKYDKENRPEVSNLILMYSLFSGKKIEEIERSYQGKGYKEFKEDLAEVINNFLDPIRDKRRELEKEEEYLARVLKDGTEKAKEKAESVMKKVRKAIRYDYSNFGF